VEHWGVAPHRIVIRGYGANRPRGATRTPTEQAAHRRVEVTLAPPQAAVSG
jgi:outer membrane protein OmpA-like peptidoglycan-associated protein